MFGVTGHSGAGKTTLIEALIPALRVRGLRVSTVKHTHHAVDLDAPGKDTYRHRAAGAEEVVFAGGARWALLREGYADLEQILARIAPVDVLLVEGFRQNRYPKLEVVRQDFGKPMLWPQDDTIRLIASDTPVAGAAIPVLPLADTPAIARGLLDIGTAFLAQGPI